MSQVVNSYFLADLVVFSSLFYCPQCEYDFPFYF